MTARGHVHIAMEQDLLLGKGKCDKEIKNIVGSVAGHAYLVFRTKNAKISSLYVGFFFIKR